jgi:hypothetical protein
MDDALSSGFEFIWNKEFDDYALVGDPDDGYCILKKSANGLLIIEDDDVSDAVIAKMLAEGMKIYPSLLEYERERDGKTDR